MSSFKEYIIDVELAAEWRQFLADSERDCQELDAALEQERRQTDTARLVEQSVSRYRRKRQIRKRLEWLVIGLLSLACGFALLGLIECWR